MGAEKNILRDFAHLIAFYVLLLQMQIYCGEFSWMHTNVTALTCKIFFVAFTLNLY
jgi:hypothetical protein